MNQTRTIHYNYKDMPCQEPVDVVRQNVEAGEQDAFFGVRLPGVKGRPLVAKDVVLELLGDSADASLPQLQGVIPDPLNQLKPEAVGPEISSMEEFRVLVEGTST